MASAPDSGFGDGPRAFARISSRTLGRYVAAINPAPPRCRSNGFQWISVALQTTPEEPRQRNGPLGAPKHRPDPPQPAPHPPRLVCGGNQTALGPTGAHLGGLPGGGAPAAGALNRVRKSRAIPKTQGPADGPPENQTAPAARDLRPGLPRYEK
jgi:hypothetical protein